MFYSCAALFAALASFTLSADFQPELALLHGFLKSFALVLAPILVIYAAVAYRGGYASRSLPVLIFLAVALALASVFHVASGSAFAVAQDQTARYLAVLDDAMRVLAMLALLFVLRGYVHSEISLIETRSWRPKDLIEKCGNCEFFRAAQKPAGKKREIKK